MVPVMNELHCHKKNCQLFDKNTQMTMIDVITKSTIYK